MIYPATQFVSLAQVSDLPTNLFRAPIDSTGVIVIGIFLAAIAFLVVRSLGQYLRGRRLEKLPALAGNPRTLLVEVSEAVGLTPADRYFLKWGAARLHLAQPVSILLSPVLLAQATQAWTQGHSWSLTTNWGLRRSARIARLMHDTSPGLR